MNDINSFTTSNSGGSIESFMSTGSSEITGAVTDLGGSIFNIFRVLSVILVILAIAISVGLLIKSISDRKKLKTELTLETINSVKVTSIILIVINALSIITNCLAVFMLIMPIISVVFASNAKKEFENDLQIAESKANTASILNIISTILPIVFAIFSIGAVVLMSTAMVGSLM